MSEFKVGDKVRVKDQANVVQVGWLWRGQVGTISRIVGCELWFVNPEENEEESIYYPSEVEHVAEEPAYGTPEPTEAAELATVEPVNLRVVALEAATRVIAGQGVGYDTPGNRTISAAKQFYEWLTKEDA